MGFLIAGLNPYRTLDESYAGFLDLIAAQLAAGLAAARARAEERRRAEALEELDRAKTAFFSNVSHEFRTPLTLMMGPLEDALQEGAQRLDPGTRDALGAAHRNSLRLLKLVNSLLDFSRLEAGRTQANFEPVDLAALTSEVAGSFRPVSEKAGLRFVVNCESGVGTVPVDRQMWEEMVLNLVSNAFKYTLSGEIRVSLESAGESALLTVADTGCGIPGEALPHLFERFYRVPDARGRTHEGTGIGLALVQEIVNLHGASIEVRSQLGEGTTVLVTVPGRTASGASVRTIELESSATRAQAFVTEAQGWLPDSRGVPIDSGATQQRQRIHRGAIAVCCARRRWHRHAGRRQRGYARLHPPAARTALHRGHRARWPRGAGAAPQEQARSTAYRRDDAAPRRVRLVARGARGSAKRAIAGHSAVGARRRRVAR